MQVPIRKPLKDEVTRGRQRSSVGDSWGLYLPDHPFRHWVPGFENAVSGICWDVAAPNRESAVLGRIRKRFPMPGVYSGVTELRGHLERGLIHIPGPRTVGLRQPVMQRFEARPQHDRVR